MEIARLAKIAERERIARDLHDLLGHTLSVIAIKAELAHKLEGAGGIGAGRDGTRAATEMREVAEVARKALAEVRRANASRASIAILCRQSRVTIEVDDNGRGGPLGAGNGLTGMRGRLTALRGEFRRRTAAPDSSWSSGCRPM